jgi:hypothetical protein
MTAAVPRRSRARYGWLAAAGLLLLLLILMFDLKPRLPPRAPPDAEQVVAGRAAFRQVKAAANAPPPSAVVTLTNADLGDIATLAGNALRMRRVDAASRAGVVHLAASVEPLPHVWLNVSADVVPGRGGFPAVDARVGEIPLPRWLSRFGLDAARQLLVWRGSELPPLDELIRRLEVDGDVVRVEIKSPLGRSGIVRQATGVITRPVDSQRVLALFCHLAAEQQRDRQIDLAVQLQRAMAAAPKGKFDAIAENRAALVAVAMMAVGRPVGDLAGDIQSEAEACPGQTGYLKLGDRVDLAKHWALSAALAAVAGNDVGRALGEFKELSDSVDGGSGFSFVDLAADRAGLRVGRAATTRATAEPMRQSLASVTNADLLPIEPSQLAEGLTNKAFVARYRDIDSPEYQAAVARIDALLDAGGLFAAPAR